MYENCGEIENFSTYGEISVQLKGLYCNLCCFVAKLVIHAVLSRIFCHNLSAFMWRKIESKSTFVEKKWKYQVWWLFDPVPHSSLDDLVRGEGIGCPIKCLHLFSVFCNCENMCLTLCYCVCLYSEVLKRESTSNALIRSSLPLVHTGDILVKCWHVTKCRVDGWGQSFLF